MKTLRLLILLILILTVNIIAQERRSIKDKEFVLKNDKWYRVYAEKEYEVNPTVITIKFKEVVDKTVVDAFIKNNNFKFIRSNQLGFVDVEIPVPNDVLGTVQSFLNNEIIEIAEANTYGSWDATPNDPRFAEQWNLEQLSDFDIDASWGWDINTGNSSVVIGILDSGTDYNQEDLGLGFDTYQNIWTNPGEDAWDPYTGNGNGIDDDGNGFIDDWKGWDFHGDGISSDKNPMPAPYNPSLKGTWHGTAVAGVASAKTNNARGIAGVAGGLGGPGAKLMILRVGDQNMNSFLIDDAILYAVNNGAKIINMSFNVPPDAAINTAIDYAYDNKGCLLVASSGDNYSTILYPANHPKVLAVGATNQNDVLESTSSRGSQQSVCAPGVSILTTLPNNQYGYVDGTSFAAPHVAGVAALILSASPDRNNAILKNIIEESAEDRGVAGWDPKYGYGRVNAYKAVRYAIHNYGGKVVSSVNYGWNMTSIPLNLINYNVNTVYPAPPRISDVYSYHSDYTVETTLNSSEGYWVKFNGTQDIPYQGTGVFSIDMPVSAGWNIIGSATQQVSISNVKPINTEVISSYFEYDNGYVLSDMIKPGKGYWVKVNQPGILQIQIPLPENPPTGVPPAPPYLISPGDWSTVDPIVTLSWSSSVGATSYNLTISKEGGYTYEYTNRTSTSFTVRLSLGTYKWGVSAVNIYGVTPCESHRFFIVGQLPDYEKDVVESFESLDQITIVDASGSRQSLFLTNEGRFLSDVLLKSTEMPPSPPDGIFNVRFESGKYIESIPITLKSKKTPIKIKNAVFPLTISWNLRPENVASYWFPRPGRGDKIYLSGSGSIVLNNLKDGVINLEGSASQPISPVGKNNFTDKQLETLPIEYGLSQNYPNPFNPETQISYALPEPTFVTLKVYDVLGRDVATLVSEYKEAGFYEVEFNGSSLSSGVYFYKLVAGNYSAVKKLLIAK